MFEDLASALPPGNPSTYVNSFTRTTSPTRFYRYVKPSGTSKRRAKNKAARAARKRNRR